MDLKRFSSLLHPAIEALREPSELPLDATFSALRDRTIEFVKQYGAAPMDPTLWESGQSLIAQWEGFVGGKSRIDASERSRVNAVIVSSRLFRTHYAAYLAGRFSADKDMPPVYRSWVLNGASNAALAVHELAVSTGPLQDSAVQVALQVLARGSLMDATRFIDLAWHEDARSPLTRFNEARAYALKGTPASVDMAFQTLESMQFAKQG